MARQPVIPGVTTLSAILSVGIHLALLAVIGMSLYFERDVIMPMFKSSGSTVEATLVSETELNRHINEREEEKKRKEEAELKRQQELDRIREEAKQLEIKRKEQAEARRKKEEAEKLEAERKRTAEKKRKAEEKKQAEEA